jgi:S1-C subfamily serine protease
VFVFWQIGPHSYPAAAAKEPAAMAPATPIVSMQDMNNTFVDISEKASPAVVTVFTDKVLKYNQTQNPFFNSPFEEFFGDFFWPTTAASSAKTSGT